MITRQLDTFRATESTIEHKLYGIINHKLSLMLLNTNVKNGPTAKMVIFINYNILNVHVVSINMISDNLFATHVWLKVASIKKTGIVW